MAIRYRRSADIKGISAMSISAEEAPEPTSRNAATLRDALEPGEDRLLAGGGLARRRGGWCEKAGGAGCRGEIRSDAGDRARPIVRPCLAPCRRAFTCKSPASAGCVAIRRRDGQARQDGKSGSGDTAD